MALVLNGSGSITGLSAGGLPDGSVTADDLAAGAVASELNATGSAPIYACRAWVNFNGTGTVAIRASGNVSSITDITTAQYTVNFTTAMPDANYSIQVGSSQAANNISQVHNIGSGGAATTSGFSFERRENNISYDSSNIYVAVFR
jgi:hypothetical protein